MIIYYLFSFYGWQYLVILLIPLAPPENLQTVLFLSLTQLLYLINKTVIMLSNYYNYLVSFIYEHAVTDQQKIVISITLLQIQ